ncbi:IclR family transcriptional regulator [Nocardia nova]|uniref:IclR family transcriptional regulator n=1 Tax=Nocardia nova TaxID=37330 RepID=UPI0033FA2286
MTALSFDSGSVPEPTRAGAQSIDRALAVLDCFAATSGLSVTAAAQRLGLPVSTTHRIVQSLVRGGLLEREGRSGRYRVGAGAAVLAGASFAQLGVHTVAPHLYALAAGIGITASFAVARDTDAITVFSAVPPVRYCHRQLPAPRQAIGASAAGQVMLAFTRLDLAAARGDVSGAALDDVRRRGYARVVTGDDTLAVAVPIPSADHGRPGALTVQASVRRMSNRQIHRMVPLMHRTATLIGHANRKG